MSRAFRGSSFTERLFTDRAQLGGGGIHQGRFRSHFDHSLASPICRVELKVTTWLISTVMPLRMLVLNPAMSKLSV